MSSPSNFPAQMIFITSFIIPILLSLQNPVVADQAMLQVACSSGHTSFDRKLCLQILASDNRTASAKNFLDMSIAIMEKGISNATNTLHHMSEQKKTNPLSSSSSSILGVCKKSYNSVITSMRSALAEVKGKEYGTATYDLLLAATDNIQPCKEAARKKNRTDRIILIGNEAVIVYGLSGYQVVEMLSQPQP